ncbi:putative helicase [Acanthamoeba castellanii mimivirus]|uniref:Putative helicase R592 n=5 Tax=Mimivirus TaxID=315393 RepID=YR592_MIMIV|nr:putative helicase [Acanthamoeba polyphaga mimivirus]Q5UP58.1 RecName: Full=Putative helicase R592 [Acanthamoeba polyphaga mimivirus]AHA45254.1 putative helicase [Hirudovirus strain Sangsue]ALR84180.1 putative helicase [Niemeyer virus]AMK61958.1 NAD-dependent DNA ligase [Samba virus]AMZ03035.1 putative helicase [Mimivirus Bombay]BAV61706.1 putative helicase [Acanthamoeba castellanii mimivirus]
MSFFELDENSPKVDQPHGLKKVKLKDHQLTSIAAMRELETQASIVIDKPEIGSKFHASVGYCISDIEEFKDSTFVIETNSAILADKVGAGKTYTTIGLILKALVPKAHDRHITGTDNFSIKMISAKECEPVNLIVVPHNLINQWADFLDKSKLKYLKLNAESDFNAFLDIDYITKVYPLTREQISCKPIKNKPKKLPVKTTKKGGSKTQNKAQNDQKIYERKSLNMKKIRQALDTHNVFLLNVYRYKLFRQIFLTNKRKWARVIIDEMDSSAVPSIFDEYGNFNWFLTATPSAIFNRSCRRYVNKIFGQRQNLLNYFVVKNKEEYVDKSMILPKPFVFMINTMIQRVVAVFKDLIPQEVLQLINSGNMKEAITKLNCDVDTEENIIKILTGKINTELHNLETELEYVNNLIPQDVDAHENRKKNIMNNIARCKTKLESIKEKINSIKDECCFICTDPFENPTIMNCCKSIFCLKCLLTTLKTVGSKCPYCRHAIKSNKDYQIISSGGTSNKKKKSEIVGKYKFNEMDKADVLEQVLSYISKNDENPKILIFSDYSQTFEKITKNIAKANLQYAYLSGTPAHITNLITEFENGITNILMLNSQNFGSGLNLQSANYLILYHRMLPELETQVIGRAQRFGRKNNLRVIFMVNDNENRDCRLDSKPINILSDSELWMITNPTDLNEEPDEESDEGSDEDVEKSKDKKSSDKKSSDKKKSEKKSSDKKSSNKKNSKKKTYVKPKSSKKTSQKVKKTDSDNESELSGLSDSDDLDDSDDLGILSDSSDSDDFGNLSDSDDLSDSDESEIEIPKKSKKTSKSSKKNKIGGSNKTLKKKAPVRKLIKV